MSTYKPGAWIPPSDHIALVKARFIVGDIDYKEFERQISHCVKGQNYGAAPGPLGSELKGRLRVSVES